MTSDKTIIQEDGFGFVPRKFGLQSGEKTFRIVRRYTMTNKDEASVRLISFGAGIQGVKIPNSRGILGDVVLGFDDIRGYLENRYIGRIVNTVPDHPAYKNGKIHPDFESDTNESTRINEKFDGFDIVNWDSCISGKQIMSYVGGKSAKENFGNMLVQAKYSWTDKNELNVNIRATAVESTPANITIFCPMNLAGHGTGASELGNHIVTINSDNFILNKQKSCKSINNVSKTFYDLRDPTRLKNRLSKIPGGGYDHNMRINSPSDWCYRFHGRFLHPGSGRFVEIYSNKSSSKFSTMNNFPDPDRKYPSDSDDSAWGACGDAPDRESIAAKEISRDQLEIRGKDGALYRRHGGFIFSPENYSIGKSACSNFILHPGQIFAHDLSYKFGIKSRNH